MTQYAIIPKKTPTNAILKALEEKYCAPAEVISEGYETRIRFYHDGNTKTLILESRPDTTQAFGVDGMECHLGGAGRGGLVAEKIMQFLAEYFGGYVADSHNEPIPINIEKFKK